MPLASILNNPNESSELEVSTLCQPDLEHSKHSVRKNVSETQEGSIPPAPMQFNTVDRVCGPGLVQPLQRLSPTLQVILRIVRFLHQHQHQQRVELHQRQHGVSSEEYSAVVEEAERVRGEARIAGQVRFQLESSSRGFPDPVDCAS